MAYRAHPLLPLLAIVALCSIGCVGTEIDTDVRPSGPLIRLTPPALAEAELWKLFDRDADTTVDVGDGLELALMSPQGSTSRAIAVRGTGAIQLEVTTPDGARLRNEVSLELDGWQRVLLERPSSSLRVRIEAGAEATLGELELWGNAPEVAPQQDPRSMTPSTTIDVMPARQATQTLALPSQSCVRFDVALERHPGAYRRTWVRYRASSVLRPLALTRAINDGSMTRGHWLPAAGEQTFASRIDRELLHHGENAVHFCVPAEATESVEISSVELIGELDDGASSISQLSRAPAGGLPVESYGPPTAEAPIALGANEELIVSFERLIAPHAVELDGDASWSVSCVDAAGETALVPAEEAEGSLLLDGGRLSCAGLRLRPDRGARVTSLRVLGSGAARRVDFPEIVLASPREHFGRHAWVDGWARAPSSVGGGARVFIDAEETGTTTGVFGRLLVRSVRDLTWPVTVRARFADGSTLEKQFVLEGDPDGAALDGLFPSAEDGLTDAAREERFGAEGETAGADVGPGAEATIELGRDVAVSIPPRAVRGRTHISITHLPASAVPPLDPGMINVTAPFARGYELLPHGTTFDEAVSVRLPYQASLLPPGYVPDDVHTYFFDTERGRWERLIRSGVDDERRTVETLTDHFTVMINAIVVVPEHPQVASFDENRLQGIEAASPAAGIVTIAPPAPSARGDAVLRYPLTLPPGRNGIQPSFALTYNSSSGNGWVGIGWDLGVSSVSIDTRWGAPRYDPARETETYTLDGEQLAPSAHRNDAEPRVADKRYHTRTEGAFQRIVRQGDSPKTYRWEVTDRTGTVFVYGGAGATLADDEGNIFQWSLSEVRDLYGNRAVFAYDLVEEGGRELYLREARYTEGPGAPAGYRVLFEREARDDAITSGRGGFLRATRERLERVEVYHRDTLVRAWALSYDEGPFGKSRLVRIAQFGVGGATFDGNVHELSYHEDLTRAAGGIDGFETALQSVEVGGTVASGLDALPGVLGDALGQPSMSALGATLSKDVGGHIYVGFNPASPSKQLSFGAKVGIQAQGGETLVSLVDVDGDGRPDRVYRAADGGFLYNRNESDEDGVRFAAEAAPVTGLPFLSQSASFMASLGAEVYPSPATIMTNVAGSASTESAYLSDVNGDGFVDLVAGSQVFFNRVLGEDGHPQFVLDDGAGTPVPLPPSAVASESMPDTLAPADFDPEAQSPPHDAVRRWRAPYAGHVRISGSARLVYPQRSGGDGVVLSVEHAGGFLLREELSPDGAEELPIDLELDVNAGDFIYFRVHAGFDGQDDRVLWAPVLEYIDLSAGMDENGLDVHRFSSAADFTLAGRSQAAVTLPFRGVLEVEGQLVKLRPTTDDVEIWLLHNGGIIQTWSIGHDEVGAVDLLAEVSVEQDDTLGLFIHTDTPIDLTALAFGEVEDRGGTARDYPFLTYVDAERLTEDEMGVVTLQTIPVFDDLGNPLVVEALRFDFATYDDRVPTAPTSVSFVPSESGEWAIEGVQGFAGIGRVTMAVKQGGALKAKQTHDAFGLGALSFAVTAPLDEDEPVYVSFTFDRLVVPVLGAAPVQLRRGGVTESGETVAYHPDLPDILDLVAFATDPASLVAGAKVASRPYRGWSAAAWDARGERAALPIPVGAFEVYAGVDETAAVDKESADGFVENPQRAIPLEPRVAPLACRFDEADPTACAAARGAHWLGAEDGVFVAADEMSTSRLGELPLPDPTSLAGARAVPRISASATASLAAGVVGITASAGVNGSTGLVDYLDLNGDGFPDVASVAAVQYTNPRGALEPDTFAGTALRSTVGLTTSLGYGASLSRPSDDPRAKAGGEGRQDPSFGIGFTAGASGGFSFAADDLLDMNGDGLPDRVRVIPGAGSDGQPALMVSFNLGYKLAPERVFADVPIDQNISVDVNGGASLSFNDGIYGYAGGLNAELSHHGVELQDLPGAPETPEGEEPLDLPLLGPVSATLVDINGDGLLDHVRPTGSSFRVRLNLGDGLDDEIEWGGRMTGADVDESATLAISGGGYFTVPVGPLCVGGCYLILNPGFSLSSSVTRSLAAVRDVDGDGYPDHVSSDASNRLVVAKNRVGRTNLLKTVKRPLGGEITIDYERVGNTRDLPQSRWVMSEVRVFDGLEDAVPGAPVSDTSLIRVRYEDGFFDRFEREFYGFAKVITEERDTRGFARETPLAPAAVFRTTEETFANRSYFTQGLLVGTRTLRGDGAVFRSATFEYEERVVDDSDDVPGPEVVFPALVRAEECTHEGDPGVFIATERTMEYDAFGNVTRVTDSGGPGAGDDSIAEIHYVADDPACRSHHIVSLARSIDVRDRAGTLLRRRAADVDCARGDVTSVRISLNASQTAVTDLDYDLRGNLVRVTAPPNRHGDRYSLEYEYDPDVHTHVARVTDSFGYTSSATYDPRFGLPVRETDLNGNRVETRYDAFGRPIEVLAPFEIAAGLPFTLRIAYFPTAPVPYATTSNMDAARDPDDPIDTITFIDGFGRAVQTKQDASLHQGDDAPTLDVMIVSGRSHTDPFGRVTHAFHPVSEPKSAALNHAFNDSVDDSAPPTELSYDVLDRLVTTRLPDGATSTSSYSLTPSLAGPGRWAKTTVKDALGNARDALTDARGRVRAVIEHIDGRTPTTHYTFDPLDQLTVVTDAAGNETRAVYDRAGRRTDVVHPDSGHTRFVFDEAGNLARRITPNLRAQGQAIEYRYDFNHLIGVDYPRFDDADVTFVWGEPGAPHNGAGRMVRTDDRSGTTTRRFDALGHVVEEIRALRGRGGRVDTYRTRYTYDTWNRLQQMVYPDGETLTYRYDSGGNVRAVSGFKLGRAFSYVTRLEYDRFEQRVFQEIGNGTRTHFAYDDRTRRLAMLEAGEFQRLRYGYDSVGNVLSLTNDVPPGRNPDYGGRVTQAFEYDGLYRLTHAEGTWQRTSNRSERYTYDLVFDDIHNIASKSQAHFSRQHGNGREIPQQKTTYEQRYTYGARPHTPTQIGDKRYFFDDNGNQTGWRHVSNGQRRAIVWDEENRPRLLRDNGRTSEYVYDSEGVRTLKLTEQGETAYVNRHWTVRNGTIGTKHVYVGRTRIASKISPGESTTEPDDQDLVSVMLGRWFEHRSEAGHDNARNVEMNPHYQVPSSLPEMGQAETNFVYFYHPDHLGSTSFVTDADGALYEHVQYFPSGELWVDQRTNTERLPYLFTGKELDEETGLYDFGARLYDPRVGLFLSADPMRTPYLDGAGLAGVYSPLNLSTYAYAGHSPVVLTDPDGRCITFVGGLDTDFAGCGATLLGYGKGVAKAIAAPGIATYYVTGAALYAATGDSTYAKQADGFNEMAQGLVDAANDPVAAVESAITSKVEQVTTAVENGDHEALGELTGEFTVTVLTAKTSKGPKVKGPKLRRPRGPDCLCFAAGTSVWLPEGAAPIEDIQVGDRLEGRGAVSAVDESWVRVRVELDDPRAPGAVYEIEALRPVEWVAALRSELSGYVELASARGWLRGRARITSVSPARLAPGDGPVVLTKVSYLADDVVEVVLDGEVLRATSAHPLWSLDREGWVPAAELRDGERLRARSGEVVVQAVRPVVGWQRVYNFEVEGERAYAAGESGVWGHNCPTGPKKTATPRLKDSDFGPKIADEIPKKGVPKNWTRDAIHDAIADYEASIASRKRELAAFDRIGGGSAIQRRAHARRITQEETFLRSLRKAAEAMDD